MKVRATGVRRSVSSAAAVERPKKRGNAVAFERTERRGERLSGERTGHVALGNLPIDGERARAEALFGPLRGMAPLVARQLEVIASGKSPIARRAREALEPIFADPKVRAASAEARADRVRSVFNRALVDVVSADALELVAGLPSQPGHVSGPSKVEGFDYEVTGYRHRVTAERFELTVKGRVIPVYRPPGGTYATRAGEPRVGHTLEELARGLSLLPFAELVRIKDVRLSPIPNPEDARWAKVYGEPGFSSYMNAGPDGQVTLFPWDPENPATARRAIGVYVLHEIGHVASNRRWGTGQGHGQSADWARWREAMKADGLFSSIYAKASAEEDFAETYSLQRLMADHPEYADELRALLPHRTRLLVAQFPG